MKKRILLVLVFVFSLFMFSNKIKANTQEMVTINKGASIRTKTDTSEQGLRFTAKLSEESLGKEHGFYLVFGMTTIEELEAVIYDETPILNNKVVFKVNVPGYNADNEFSIVLTGMPERGYLDALTSIPYVKDNNGYHFSKAPITRSIAEVAVSLKNAGYNNPSYDAIIDSVSDTKRFVCDDEGNLKLSLGIIETNPLNLKKDFIKDWYQKFGVVLNDFTAEEFYLEARKPLMVTDEETNKNISQTNLYKFFSETPQKLKWEWVLDLLAEVDVNNSFLTSQVLAIKEGGVDPQNNNLYNGKNLSYSIANFFNKTNEGGNDNLDFTNENHYNDLAIKNKHILINPNNYQALYRQNEEIHIPEPTIKSPDGYNFKHYQLNGEIINPGDLYTPTQDDCIFIPQYEPINYNVKFFDGAIEINNLSTTYNIETQLTFEVPQKEGHEFLGWYNNPGLQGEPLLGLNTGNFGHLDLYSKWKTNKYIITFNSSGGSNVADLELDFGATINAPINLTKEGYTFIGWTPALPSTMPANNLTVTAQWSPIDYTITFSGNGGSDSTKIVAYDSEIGTLPTSTRAGYTFNGWFTATSGGTKITNTTKPQGTKTYYAQWTIIEYSIAFHINGGSWPLGPEEPGYTNRDTMITDFLTDFYNFVNASENLTTFIHGAGNTSGFDGLYSESNYFNMLYAADVKGVNASTGKFINQPQYNKWEPLLDLMDEYTGFNPEQVGEFWGSPWTGERRIKPFIQHTNLWTNTVSNEDVTAVTSRIPQPLTVGTPGPAITPPSKYKTTEEITLPIPLKSGSPFLGWYNNSNFTGTAITKIPIGSDGNKVFYAKWDVPTTFTITYNLNGGAFTGYTSKTTLGTDFLTDFYNFVNPSENLTTFMHGAGNSSGFAGTWYSDEVHRGKIFGANIKIGNNNYFLSHSSYQAKWKPFADFMVTFVKVGNPDQDYWSSPYTGNMRMWQYLTNVKPGSAWSDTDMSQIPSGLAASVYYEYDANSPTITLSSPIRSGFEFVGWYTANTGGTKVTTIPTGSSGNKVFYARWEEFENPELIALMNLISGGHRSTLDKKTITYYGFENNGQTYPVTQYAFVNRYLFNEPLSIDKTTYWLPTSRSNHPNIRKPIEWVVLHDTGSSSQGARGNANYLRYTSPEASWHYTVGNEGIYHSMDEDMVAWHASSGSSYTVFHNTNISATNPYLRPKLGLSSGYYTINGTKTNVAAPAGALTSQFPSEGLWPVIINGKYHINDTQIRTGGVWGGAIGFDGGNYNGVGIETSILHTEHIWWTWHKTSKLIADILVRNNLLPDRLTFHNTFNGKSCPQTAIKNNLLNEWLEMIFLEYKIRKDYSNYTINFTTHSPSILNSTGRVPNLQSSTTNVSYTVKLTDPNGVTFSKTFTTSVRA